MKEKDKLLLEKKRAAAADKFLPCYPQIVRRAFANIHSLSSRSDIDKLVYTYNSQFPHVPASKEISNPKAINEGKVNCLSTVVLLGHLALELGLPHCWYAYQNPIGNRDIDPHWSIGIPLVPGRYVSKDEAQSYYDSQRTTEQSHLHFPVPIIWLHWVIESRLEPIGIRVSEGKRTITNPHGSTCVFNSYTPRQISIKLIERSPLASTDKLNSFEFTELATVS